MDTSKAKKKAKKELKFAKVNSFAVSDARVITTKNDNDLIFFTLTINEVKIYNCRVATGKNGDFISFPQYKGSDGTYYSNVYVCLSEEDTTKILAELQKELDKDE